MYRCIVFHRLGIFKINKKLALLNSSYLHFKQPIRTLICSRNLFDDFSRDEKLQVELNNFLTADKGVTNFEERCIKRTSNLFNIDLVDAKLVVQCYRKHFLENIDYTIEKCELLKTRLNIPSKAILNNVWLFDMSFEYLEYCFNDMDNWEIDNKKLEMLKLILLPEKYFKRFSKRCIQDKYVLPHKNLAFYLADILECSIEEAIEMLLNEKRLILRSYDLLDSVFRLLLEYNVSIEDIKNDYWILMYSLKLLMPRLTLLKKNDLAIKPWMLRCSEDRFNKHIETKISERKIRNGQSTEDYLAKRLNTDLKYIQYLTLRYPNLREISIIKVEEKIDFLYREGYTNDHILEVPRIMNYNIYTIKERIYELRNLGCITPSLSKVCRNKTMYQQVLENYIRMKISSSSNK